MPSIDGERGVCGDGEEESDEEELESKEETDIALRPKPFEGRASPPMIERYITDNLDAMCL
jgi:hypothetical protein